VWAEGGTLSENNLNWIANFIWGIADDVLRRCLCPWKIPDVILPMTVIRRLDAVLEPTKQAVLDMKDKLDRAGIVADQHMPCARRRTKRLQHIQVHPPRPSGARKATAAQS